MTSSMPLASPRKYHVLYIEDSPGDTEFLSVAFRATNPSATLTVVANGLDALRLLHGEAPYQGLPPVDLVLLDLKLPGKDGHEILAEVKSDPNMRKLPVIILTSSKLDEDVGRAYETGANCYLPKPPDARGYQAIVASIDEFWLHRALLPKPEFHA